MSSVTFWSTDISLDEKQFKSIGCMFNQPHTTNCVCVCVYLCMGIPSARGISSLDDCIMFILFKEKFRIFMIFMT